MIEKEYFYEKKNHTDDGIYHVDDNACRLRR